MTPNQYFIFLRGINVGGHKKVPMAQLKTCLEENGFQDVKTVLNSGNVSVVSTFNSTEEIEAQLTQLLETTFGFPIPVIARKASSIKALMETNPFAETTLTKDTRRYISFLKAPKKHSSLEIPYTTDDDSFTILSFTGSEVVSILDVSKIKSTDAMIILEKHFGKNITTRNWNTLEKMEKWLKP
jgi:uncharacterized protein (DUF1697 family)